MIQKKILIFKYHHSHSEFILSFLTIKIPILFSKTFSHMENFSYYQSFCFEETETFSSTESHTPLYEKIIIDNKKTYKCLVEKCEKSFRFKSDMERHIIVHSKERPFACKYPYCNKSFKRPDALKNHMQVHNEGFPFACAVPGCSLRFHKKTSLQYHILKHNEERFFCDFPGCEKSFMTLKHLKQHQSSTACHKRFTLSSPKDSNGFDCFLNHFEDLTPAPHLSPKNSFNDDEFNPKSEKFLHTEVARAPCSHSETATPETSSKLAFKDFVQLTVCKHLLEENQQMKAKLAVRADPIKAKYENHLNSMLKMALSSQFDLT